MEGSRKGAGTVGAVAIVGLLLREHVLQGCVRLEDKHRLGESAMWAAGHTVLPRVSECKNLRRLGFVGSGLRWTEGHDCQSFACRAASAGHSLVVVHRGEAAGTVRRGSFPFRARRREAVGFFIAFVPAVEAEASAVVPHGHCAVIRRLVGGARH